jgi:hypothetical protein
MRKQKPCLRHNKPTESKTEVNLTTCKVCGWYRPYTRVERYVRDL